MTVASPGAKSACSMRARTGVTPIPAATNTTFGRVRASWVKIPYGPSMDTRVPTGTDASDADPSPSARTVMRRLVSDGTADRDSGCACHQVAPVQKRQTRNCPPAACNSRKRLPVSSIDTTPGATSTTRRTVSPCRTERTIGRRKRYTTTRPTTAMYSASQYARCSVPSTNRPPTLSWCGTATSTAA